MKAQTNDAAENRRRNHWDDFIVLAQRLRPGSPIRGRDLDRRLRIRITEVNQLATGLGYQRRLVRCVAV
jgi:hypothetical protein